MVKKVKNILQDSKICKLHVEKSSLAKALEKDYSLEWGFNQTTTFDPYFHLRACVIKDIVIEPGEVVIIPTGIYTQLINPGFVIEVCSDYDLLLETGLSVFDSPMLFDFTFTNEIHVLIKNNFNQAQIIQPAKKVAILSIRQLPQTVIKYVDMIEESPWKNKGKKFVQEFKKKFNPEIYDQKKFKTSEFYSREDIDNYIRKHNGS